MRNDLKEHLKPKPDKATLQNEPRGDGVPKKPNPLEDVIVLVFLIAALYVLLSGRYERVIVDWAIGILALIAARFITRR